MYGAILGDMIGAPYEFDHNNIKTKDFPLFSRGSQFTDDSVMTVAVAEALLGLNKDADDETVRYAVTNAMRTWARKYPDAGYGTRFIGWLFTDGQPRPYNSWGNGSAMRISAVGWLYDSIEETRRYAKLTAEVTHNHPEGIKGAEAAASAIFMARTGAAKDEIKDYIIREFGYDLSRTCDEIRPYYHHVESCQETVPEAITAFLEGNGFEDVIRTAVSLGGDCDTLTCIAGSIAEAFYGVPEDLKKQCRKRLPEDMLAVLDGFDQRRSKKTILVVAAVICHEGRFFATQRGYGEWKDYWEFPGGKIEAGETPEEALVREIREELDTEILVGQKITTVEYDYPAFHLVMECYSCEVTKGHLILKEHEAAKWLRGEELDSVGWLPADREIIELLKRTPG